ncbi:MAG: PorP/SprF family type IX secretion system membrane protein [Bacteroidetes bacterium]|nr:PorP/SprF family type IX secretion system membrane protein [Bacteroidota bacterium]
MIRRLTYAALFFMPLLGAAQDVHFSQIRNVPLYLNPALNGSFEGNFRAVINHRSQWSSISDPFVSSAVSFDSRNWEDRLKGDAIGLGLIVIRDISGASDLTVLDARIGVSYHKHIDVKGYHMVSLGAYGGFIQKSIDGEKLIFESQFIETEFDPTIDSRENFESFSIIQPDLHTGILYSYSKDDENSYKAGLSVFHLTRPDQSFLGQIDRLSPRFVFHANSSHMLQDNLRIGPAIQAMYQNGAKEVLSGLTTYYLLESDAQDKVTLEFGAWSRLSGWDAVILTTGLDYKNWRFGFSYDLNVSTLKTASSARGAFELSIIYIDRILAGGRMPVIVPCQRMFN